MSPNIVVYTLLAFLSSSLLENATAQHDSWSFIKSLDAMKIAMENLQTKIELQADLLSSLVTKAEMQENSFGNLQAKEEELKTLLLNSTVKEEEQVASLSKLEQQSETQMTSLNKVQAGLENQTTVLNTLVSKEELESILLNNLATKSDMEMQKIELQNLEAKAGMHDNSLGKLQATVEELKNLLIKSSKKEDEQLTSLSNLESQSNNQTIMLNRVGEHLENQTSLMNNFFTKEEMHVNNLKNVEAKATTASDCVETLAEGIKNLTASKGIVEGIIAGTSSGVVIVPLDLQEQRTISSNDTDGVAFNWQSRKVYWIENQVGIKIADLDGSNAELLLSDSNLRGLAVDQITGNLYYGEMGDNARIRVCDSMGKKCVTVASMGNNVGQYIWDIALLPSEGLMFWSSPNDKIIVVRANMDGKNATTIISEHIFGLYLDEFTEKLYWANYWGKSIGHCDLNGCNRNVLLKTTMEPNDIAVDGDTLYFGGYSPRGVYSVTGNGEASSIANTTGDVWHIALFGRNKVSSRPNPCYNSPCANLCVLTRLSYTCL